MEEEKRNRIKAAITVTAILFLFIVVAVIIYQLIEVGILKKRLIGLKNTETNLTQILKESEDDLERLQTDEEYLENRIKIEQMKG